MSAVAREMICDPTNRKFVSMATPWEVAIKASRKKINIGGEFAGFFDEHMIRTFFEWLQIATKHLDFVATLPFHHSDPFDRLIVAQALSERLPIVSSDRQFDSYGVQRLW